MRKINDDLILESYSDYVEYAHGLVFTKGCSYEMAIDRVNDVFECFKQQIGLDSDWLGEKITFDDFNVNYSSLLSDTFMID